MANCNGKGWLERNVDELIALIVVVVSAAVAAVLGLKGGAEGLKAYFQYYIAPLVVPVITYYFGSKRAEKMVDQMQNGQRG